MDISTIHLYSYNGVVIGDGTNYESRILLDVAPTSDSDIQEVQRSHNTPIYADKILQSRLLTFNIEVIGGDFGVLTNLFSPYDTEEHTLIALDDSAGQWSVQAVTKTIQKQNFNDVTVQIYIADPVWKSENYNTYNWVVTSSGQYGTLTVGGNQSAQPIFNVSPTSARTGSYAYKRYIGMVNNTTTEYKDAIDVTNGGIDTASIIPAKMQADGDDVRLIYEASGQEVYRWFGHGGINSADTAIIANVLLPAKVSLTLDTAINNSSAITSIKVQNTAANTAALGKLAAQAYKVLAIDFGTGSQEYFTYTGVNVSGLLITGVAREQKGSSKSAHSTGAAIITIAGYAMIYGSASAIAPTTDNTMKPYYDLVSFTNTSRMQGTFLYEGAFYPMPDSKSGLGAWRYFYNLPLKAAGFYQSTQGTGVFTNEVLRGGRYSFTTLGMYIGSYGTIVRNPGDPKNPSVIYRTYPNDVSWSFSHPAGITNVNDAGEYKKFDLWPTTAACNASGKVIWSESAAGSAGTWGTFSHNISTGGTVSTLTYQFKGIAESAYFGINQVTVTLGNVPSISLGAEQNNNQADFRITNVTTGQWLEVHSPVPLGYHVIVDTELLNCYIQEDNSVIPVLLDDESRGEWLPLVVGTNVLQYTEDGVVKETIAITWKDVSL